MKVLKINKGKAIPLPFRFFSVIVLAFIIIKSMQSLEEPWSIIVSIILSMILPAIWFATNIIAIDMSAKSIFDGTWIMGFRVGKPIPFDSIEKIYINKVKTSQTTYSLANNKSVVTNHEYRAYLKTNSGEKFYLFSHPLEEKAREKVLKAQQKLGIQEF